jgi:hypothetical protein
VLKRNEAGSLMQMCRFLVDSAAAVLVDFSASTVILTTFFRLLLRAIELRLFLCYCPLFCAFGRPHFTLLKAPNACYFEGDNSFGRLTLLAARLPTPQ